MIGLFIPHLFTIIFNKIRDLIIFNFLSVDPIISENKTIRLKKNKRAFLIATGPSLKKFKFKTFKESRLFYTK